MIGGGGQQPSTITHLRVSNEMVCSADQVLYQPTSRKTKSTPCSVKLKSKSSAIQQECVCVVCVRAHVHRAEPPPPCQPYASADVFFGVPGEGGTSAATARFASM